MRALVAGFLGVVAGLGVACGTTRGPIDESDATAPVGTGTSRPDASAAPDAETTDASDAAPGPDAADAAIPPGWCANGPQATAPKLFMEVSEAPGCLPQDCPTGAKYVGYTTDIADRAEYERTPPNRVQGCKLGATLSAWCCPQACTKRDAPECATAGFPLPRGYYCYEQPDGSVPTPMPSTNCVNLQQIGGTNGRLWCCDDSKPY